MKFGHIVVETRALRQAMVRGKDRGKTREICLSKAGNKVEGIKQKSEGNGARSFRKRIGHGEGD